MQSGGNRLAGDETSEIHNDAKRPDVERRIRSLD